MQAVSASLRFVWRPRIGYGVTDASKDLWPISDIPFARESVKRILKKGGSEPALVRAKKTTRHEFLGVHWDSLAASDFFTLEVWSPFGLVRNMVFFVIELQTRRVKIAGVAPDPNGQWESGSKGPD